MDEDDGSDSVTQDYGDGKGKPLWSENWRRTKETATRTYVFLHDLLETSFEGIPWENFDVLLDAAGLGYREIHEELEKLGQGSSRDGSGPYELEVAPDATPLIGRALPVSDELDEFEHVHGGIPPFPSHLFLRLGIFQSHLVVDARDDEEPFGVLLWRNMTKG